MNSTGADGKGGGCGGRNASARRKLNVNSCISFTFSKSTDFHSSTSQSDRRLIHGPLKIVRNRRKCPVETFKTEQRRRTVNNQIKTSPTKTRKQNSNKLRDAFFGNRRNAKSTIRTRKARERIGRSVKPVKLYIVTYPTGPRRESLHFRPEIQVKNTFEVRFHKRSGVVARQRKILLPLE